MNQNEIPEELGGDEASVLRSAVAQVFPDEPQTSFEILVQDYRTFVHSVRGYAFSIYDYDNDLSVREAIDSVLELCPPELRQKLAHELEPLDAKFMAETVEMQRTSGSVDAAKPVTWYTRIPKQPGEELQSDIDSGNL